MKYYFVLLLFAFVDGLSAQCYTGIAVQKTDTVKVYVSTLVFEKDTILPSINIFSKTENTESIILLIISGDTLPEPLNKMYVANAHSRVYAFVGKNHLYNKHCYIYADINMSIFKKMKYPQSDFKIRYYKDITKRKNAIRFEEEFEPYKTTIPINIINE